MDYIGEHLLPGQLGTFFLVLSLIASLVATIGYFKANKTNDVLQKKSWLKLSRIAFLLETISVFATFIILYYIISNHLFEYKYAWQHSDRGLQTRYLLSCFWEGQEGSFMLWSFWHCVLGWILIWRAGKWEAGTMTVVSFMQFCLATMILGFYFFGDSVKIGSNPFVLLRNEMTAPIFSTPDYLSKITDGNGLNVLLQNYWMVIHPPVLFLGFALTIVPFAYCYAGLVNNDHTWVKPALPWGLVSSAILGLGIMMGAKWAYESLSFGGYWAWDPVENASLVPWLTLIAGFHTNIIYKSTGRALRSTYFFYIISFLLILYSTFLTRSGVLGDTSVHAFTDLGMNVQLLVFLLIFVIPSLVLFIIKYKKIPAIHTEENTFTREFWMFIGSLVLLLSATIIILKTSLPVINKLFGSNFAPPTDVEFSYNQIQIFVGIILGILTAVSQYFKYKSTPKGYFIKKMWLPLALSLLISIIIMVTGYIQYDKKGLGFLIAIEIALFAAIFALLANLWYIFAALKGKLKMAGASIAHVGFGMMLVGILISSGNKVVLSWNTTGINVFEKNKDQDPAENLTLFKGTPTDMKTHMVTYVQDTMSDKERKRFFEIDFKDKTGNNNFQLYPDLIKPKNSEQFSANPDAMHYIHKDIFAYLTYYESSSENDTTKFSTRSFAKGDTLFYSNGIMVLNDIVPSQNATPDDLYLEADITVTAKDGRMYKATPRMVVKDGVLTHKIDTVRAQNLILSFTKLSDEKKGTIEIGIKESNKITDLITLKVFEFPMINFLWFGIIVMMIGFVMSTVQRVKAKF